MNRHSAWVFVPAFCLVVCASAFAQEATITGTITDPTGGVLPGVTVTAVNDDSGNTFVAVSDGSGAFRLPVRIGSYRIAAELSGFTTAPPPGVQMQINQGT